MQPPELYLIGPLKRARLCSTEPGTTRRLKRDGKPGVYLWTHGPTGCTYIGESQNAEIRIRNEWQSILNACGWRWRHKQWIYTGQVALVQEPWIRRFQRQLLEDEMAGVRPEHFAVQLLERWEPGAITKDQRNRIQWQWIWDWMPDLNSLDAAH